MIEIKKKTLLITLATVIGLVIIAIAASASRDSQIDANNSLDAAAADTIEVVHFHATQQCWSCITVGDFALKTLKENFAADFASGRVRYLDVNVESPENRAIVNQYRATGSALFINAIVDGEYHITEDVTVWRLVTNEKQFKEYLTSKIAQLLKE